MDSTITLSLCYIGVKHTLGVWKNKVMYLEFRKYLKIYGYNHDCWLCGKKVSKNERSLDHAVPQSVCFELELPMLLFDHRNFRVAHQTCNTKRGSRISDLPLSITYALDKRRKLLYHQK